MGRAFAGARDAGSPTMSDVTQAIDALAGAVLARFAEKLPEAL
jgi:hypothetical protein